MIRLRSSRPYRAPAQSTTGPREMTTHDSHVGPTPWQGIYTVHTHSEREFPRHWHDTYGFGLMLDGGHRSASARGEVEAYAGDVIASNPGEIHDGRPLGAQPRRWRMVSIDTAAMAAIGASAAGVEFTLPVIRDPRLVRALVRLFRHLEQWNGGRGDAGASRFACEEALVTVCTLLISQNEALAVDALAPTGYVRLVRDRLADMSRNAPTLDELAALAGLSKFTVLRLFQRAYGLPPHAWLLQRRAETARDLIRSGASLAVAAARCGFADQSHMTRIFVKHYGYTPGAWRRATRGARAATQ